MDQKSEITLIDAETNISYSIVVTHMTLEKAKNDPAYATELLEQAKRHAEQESQEQESQRAKENQRELEEKNEVEKSMHNWTHEETTVLLAAYQNNMELFNNEKKARSECWAEVTKEIAMVLKKKDLPPIPVKKCISKMESLKRHYKAVKDHNKKSGNSRRTWSYLKIMDEIFRSRPWVQPLSTAGSDVVEQQETTSKPAKRQRACIQPMLVKMLEEKEKREQRREAQRNAQHKEKMEILYSLMQWCNQHSQL